MIDIFDRFEKTERRVILIAAAFVALLTPFCDTVYLPALTDVGSNLNASTSQVGASVSLYMMAVGVFMLAWGTCADHYGRWPVLLWTLVVFTISSLGCAFSPTITVLIIIRTIQGGAVGATVIVGQGIVADIFAPHERGAAIGVFLLPLLLGPIFAPIIGGVLAVAYGWRSTMVLLAVMGLIGIGILFFLIPETSHFLYYQSLATGAVTTSAATIETELGSVIPVSGLSSAVGSAVYSAVATDSSILGATIPVKSNDPGTFSDIDLTPHPSTTTSPTPSLPAALTMPPLQSPVASLQIVLGHDMLVFQLLFCLMFGVMFFALTLLPVALAAAPYSLSPAVIGLCFIPAGLGSMLGSQGGGISADRSAVRYSQTPFGRLVYGLTASVCLPMAALAYGWLVQTGAWLGWVLLAHMLIGFGQACFMPAYMSTLTSVHQKQASTASAAAMSLMFLLAGILILVAALVVEAVGFGPLFTVAAGLVLLIQALSGAVLYGRL